MRYITWAWAFDWRNPNLRPWKPYSDWNHRETFHWSVGWENVGQSGSLPENAESRPKAHQFSTRNSNNILDQNSNNKRTTQQTNRTENKQTQQQKQAKTAEQVRRQVHVHIHRYSDTISSIRRLARLVITALWPGGRRWAYWRLATRETAFEAASPRALATSSILSAPSPSLPKLAASAMAAAAFSSAEERRRAEASAFSFVFLAKASPVSRIFLYFLVVGARGIPGWAKRSPRTPSRDTSDSFPSSGIGGGDGVRLRLCSGSGEKMWLPSRPGSGLIWRRGEGAKSSTAATIWAARGFSGSGLASDWGRAAAGCFARGAGAGKSTFTRRRAASATRLVRLLARFASTICQSKPRLAATGDGAQRSERGRPPAWLSQCSVRVTIGVRTSRGGGSVVGVQLGGCHRPLGQWFRRKARWVCTLFSRVVGVTPWLDKWVATPVAWFCVWWRSAAAWCPVIAGAADAAHWPRLALVGCWRKGYRLIALFSVWVSSILKDSILSELTRDRLPAAGWLCCCCCCCGWWWCPGCWWSCGPCW